MTDTERTGGSIGDSCIPQHDRNAECKISDCRRLRGCGLQDGGLQVGVHRRLQRLSHPLRSILITLARMLRFGWA